MMNLECGKCEKKRDNFRTVMMGDMTLERFVFDFVEST